MKILFIPTVGGLKLASDYRSEYQMGAIEQQVFGIAKELSAKGNEVFILRPWDGPKSVETLSGVKLINVNVYAFQRGFHENLSFIRTPLVLFENLMFFIKAYKTIKKLNPDVIHMSAVLPGYVAFFINSHSSRFFTTHTHDIYLDTGVSSLIKRKMIKSIAKKSDKFVALTDGIKNYLVDLGFRVDAVVPNAVNLHNYEYRTDCRFILFAGRLVPHKKVEDLIKVYSEICGDHNEDLVIIGSGPCEKKLQKYASSLDFDNRVHFKPFLPRFQYRQYLSECSIFVFPSDAEAFGVVIIEAMASGKPVIARNIVGPKDIITHGYDGFLFETNKELKKYLRILLTDAKLRKKIGKNARKTVEQKYTFNRIADSYEKLYKCLCRD